MSNHSRDKTITVWAQLVDCVGEYRDGWIFRGESDPSNEKLIPKVGRYSQKRGALRKVPYKFEDEIQSFNEFKRAARPYLSHEPKSDIEWLSIAQHHGVPTRLLDWTESLLVAALFAVEQAGTLGDEEIGGAVIYAVKGIDAIDEEKESPFTVREVKTYKPPHISPRIPAQKSIFSIHPNPTAPFSFHSLERWVLDKNVCWDVKRNLDACGINEGSVYPDIDGLCRYIAWRYKWGFFQSK